VKAQAGIDPSRKGMDLSQCFGSSSSYARKYALSGLFLLDDSKDADGTNTGGKDTDNKKSELIASVSKLPENKRAAALETINNATDMKTLVIIEDRINKLVQ